MKEDGTKWVVFIDALSPNDMERSEFLDSSMVDLMHSTPPRVTPRVMSSIYTGLDPAENGMMRAQMQGYNATRPEQQTVMERVARGDRDVLSLNMPFSIPFQGIPEGSAMMGTSMGGQQQVTPQNMSAQMVVPGPQGDLISEKRHDIVFDHFVDYTTQLFSTARTLAPEYDVVFIGFRLIDSYCHFQFGTGEDGRGANVGERYRDRLAEVVDIQLQQLAPRGPVLWFSDHGATHKDDTFYVNKWLSENGYLDYTIDETFRRKAIEQGLMQGEQHPVNTRVENQVVVGAPGVRISGKSQAVCSDPFDTCITLLDDSVRDELTDDLGRLDVYRDVYHRSDLFDTGGEFYDQTPHIIPDRDDGVFVSGNVHPNPIGMGWYRTGVHDQWGCYGSTEDVGGGTVEPEGMNGVIRQFLDLDARDKR